ncbi:Predicted phosphohydrolase, MPP superfamily [Corynebacterium mycetoides]|uniref:Predicted phosphohydrolase, MPP superfamily n=1 Tax=Corynebacterium mycetoides TaxID=38302 RepID=A0A1G9Q4D7_9CORY|nr:metallophosphoesterase [Corynebacterium mycetoides]SDM05902.1 Predicted phosphohydrolase, MPP superfamily [Corynebacterium mycetoides]
MKTRHTVYLAAGAAVAAGLSTLTWGAAELHKFRLKTYRLPLLAPGTLRGADAFSILHVSDLHMIPGQRDKIAWVSALDALNPDLVINTGDNLSDVRGVPYVLEALGPLLDRPGAFVFGTNDYWAPRPVNPLKYLSGSKREPSYVDLPWEGMRAAFVERGWRDATHQRLEFKEAGVRLALAGVDDPHHDLDRYEEIAGTPNADADLSIGLLHAPYRRVLSAFEADGYDLALAGHTHGGQICLPGERALVTNADIDRERASGMHRYGGMWMEVSNGLGTSKYAPVRIFCRPSAALIRVTEREG